MGREFPGYVVEIVKDKGELPTPLWLRATDIGFDFMRRPRSFQNQRDKFCQHAHTELPMPCLMLAQRRAAPMTGIKLSNVCEVSTQKFLRSFHALRILIGFARIRSLCESVRIANRQPS